MTSFVPAEVLKREYEVFGHFYSVRINPKTIIECRSVLEIVNRSAHLGNREELLSRRPDAVFIMMNPGSSKPVEAVSNLIDADQIHRLAISLVPTKPDTTQYQVMRVMHYSRWRHVRVLNLSDLRCSKSNEFYKQFRDLETTSRYDAHSLFSASRRQELNQKIASCDQGPIVCAWGLAKQLDPLIAQCMKAISTSGEICGVLAPETRDKYRHPLPSLQTQKAEWLESMLTVLASMRA